MRFRKICEEMDVSIINFGSRTDEQSSSVVSGVVMTLERVCHTLHYSKPPK